MSYQVKTAAMMMRDKTDAESSGYMRDVAAKNGHIIALVMDEIHASYGTAVHYSEIARAAGMGEAKVLGILQGLWKYGFAERKAKGRWSLLPAAYYEVADKEPPANLKHEWQENPLGTGPAVQFDTPLLPCPDPSHHVLMVGQQGHALPVNITAEALGLKLLEFLGLDTISPKTITIELTENEQDYLLSQIARARDYYRENDKGWTRREDKRAEGIQKKISDAKKKGA